MSTSPVTVRLRSFTQHPEGKLGELVLQGTVFVVAAALFLSRRPDALLSPQFFAEDGAVWYANAYHLGIRSLLLPEAGYLHTVSRLAALLALLFPLRAAPLVMNLCALVVQILPVNLFLSRRFSFIPFNIRLLGCFLYVALPNTFEIDANMTTVQWHLALLACLVLFAGPGRTAGWRIFDVVVLVLISLDGPMGILLTPLAFLVSRMRQDYWHRVLWRALLPGSVIQGLVLLLFQSQRKAAPNGASITRLINILGRQVFLSAFLGINSVRHLVSAHWFFGAELLSVVVGFAVLVYALRAGPAELRLFIGLAAVVMSLSLVRPLASGTMPQWEALSWPGGGDRYYFFPLLAFMAALVWMATNRGTPRPIRYCAVTLLLLSSVGICRDWRYRPFLDLHFQEYAARFEEAAPGTRMEIPINPRNWSMELIKK